MSNMLLVTQGTGGDVNPFVALGRGLRARGHTVTLFSNCCYAGLAERAGLGFVALDDPAQLERMIADRPLMYTPHGLNQFLKQHVLPNIAAQYRAIRALHQPGDTVLISYGLGMIAPWFATEKLEVPLMAVYSSPIQPDLTPIIQQLIGPVHGDDINRSRAALGLAPVSDWHAWCELPQHTLGCWPDWFYASDAPWPPHSTAIGFVTYDANDAGAAELPPDDPAPDDRHPILIVHGTSAEAGPTFFAAGAQACRLLGRPGLLVTRHANLVPDELPEGVVWRPYLPFGEAMPRAAAVIHHAGLGTVAHALRAGVPQLALPFGFDRPYNAARVKELGVGDLLPPPYWQPELMAASLARLLADQSVHARCAELARRCQEADSVAKGCDLIERLLADQPASAPPQRNTLRLCGQPDDVASRLDQLPAERRALLELRLRQKRRPTISSDPQREP